MQDAQVIGVIMRRERIKRETNSSHRSHGSDECSTINCCILDAFSQESIQTGQFCDTGSGSNHLQEF